MNGKEKPAVHFSFLNNTGCIVYLTNVRILKCSKKFIIDKDASMDIAESSYELKFMDKNNGHYIHRQIILQTDETAQTSIAVEDEVNKEILSYKRSKLRQRFRRPKYFCLEYVAMVGNKRYKVSLIY